MSGDNALTQLADGIAADERIARGAVDPNRPGTHWQWVTCKTDVPVKPGDEQEALDHQHISLRTVEHFMPHTYNLPAFAIAEVGEGYPGALAHVAHFDPARILRQARRLRQAAGVVRELIETGDHWAAARGEDLAEILADIYMNEDELITATCLTCRTGIHWIECPTGGWWAHDIHPNDHHDAESPIEVDEQMDDNGYWYTIHPGETED